ncbi:hypothetical protein, partial [Pseudomonas sp. L-22-4S-12]|uniref:hypothetical protein n=1 Tax=Pseudomonas sp. L-22-4S-12 TaxID=2610893 RepID=UPI001C498033
MVVFGAIEIEDSLSSLESNLHKLIQWFHQPTAAAVQVSRADELHQANLQARAINLDESPRVLWRPFRLSQAAMA